MRSIMTKGGIPVFVSGPEYDFIEDIDESVFKADLTERQAELARMLTSRGVLQRFSDVDKGIYYMKNQNNGLE